MRLFGRKRRRTKHAMLKRVVRLCLALIVLITLGSFATAWRAGEQISSSTVAALMGGICGELLMSLSKRKHDDKVEQSKPAAEPEDESI